LGNSLTTGSAGGQGVTLIVEPRGELHRYEGPVCYQQAYFQFALREEMSRGRESGSPLSIIFLTLPEFSRGSAQRLLGFAEQLPPRCFLGLLTNGDYVFCLPNANVFQANAVSEQLLGWLEDFEAMAAVLVLADGRPQPEAPRERRRQGRMGPRPVASSLKAAA
jgi:hypothetical protein